jgi:hypothetical protein
MQTLCLRHSTCAIITASNQKQSRLGRPQSYQAALSLVAQRKLGTHSVGDVYNATTATLVGIEIEDSPPHVGGLHAAPPFGHHRLSQAVAMKIRMRADQVKQTHRQLLEVDRGSFTMLVSMSGAA